MERGMVMEELIEALADWIMGCSCNCAACTALLKAAEKFRVQFPHGLAIESGALKPLPHVCGCKNTDPEICPHHVSNIISVTDSNGNMYTLLAPGEGGYAYSDLRDGTYLVVRRVKQLGRIELTTRLKIEADGAEIKADVFVPVRISLDNNATPEQKSAWESLGPAT